MNQNNHVSQKFAHTINPQIGVYSYPAPDLRQLELFQKPVRVDSNGYGGNQQHLEQFLDIYVFVNRTTGRECALL